MTSKAITKNKQRCLIINKGEFIDKVLASSKFKQYYKPVFYDTKKQKRPLSKVIEQLKAKVILIESFEVNNLDRKVVREIADLRLKNASIYSSEGFYELINRRIPIVKLERHEYLGDDIFSIRMRKRFVYFKRLFDIIFVLLAFPFTFPLVLIGCLLTTLTSKGGMFFVQERVGKGGKLFKIFKIRTMVVNGGGFTVKNDARITPLGNILRKTKIDELPQLYNILRGDMSLIGPRPEQPKYVEEYANENPFFNLRHMIRPGVSGWAQIHLPKATPEDNLKKLEYDLYYIKRYSLALDFEVIKKTIQIVLTLESH